MGGGMAGGAPTWIRPTEGMDQKLRKRIGWLNSNGGFANAIQYDKVAEAAVGLDEFTVLKILKTIEDKGVPNVKDPTA